MAPVHAAADHLAHERLEQCLRALHGPGWEQRLRPVAAHRAAQRLVLARGYAGGPVRQLDLTLLREALNS